MTKKDIMATSVIVMILAGIGAISVQWMIQDKLRKQLHEERDTRQKNEEKHKKELREKDLQFALKLHEINLTMAKAIAKTAPPTTKTFSRYWREKTHENGLRIPRIGSASIFAIRDSNVRVVAQGGQITIDDNQPLMINNKPALYGGLTQNRGVRIRHQAKNLNYTQVKSISSSKGTDGSSYGEIGNRKFRFLAADPYYMKYEFFEPKKEK